MTRPESSVEERARNAASAYAPNEAFPFNRGYLAAARTEGILRAIEEIEKLVPEVCPFCADGEDHFDCRAAPLHAALGRLRKEMEGL